MSKIKLSLAQFEKIVKSASDNESGLISLYLKNLCDGINNNKSDEKNIQQSVDDFPRDNFCIDEIKVLTSEDGEKIKNTDSQKLENQLAILKSVFDDDRYSLKLSYDENEKLKPGIIYLYLKKSNDSSTLYYKVLKDEHNVVDNPLELMEETLKLEDKKLILQAINEKKSTLDLKLQKAIFEITSKHGYNGSLIKQKIPNQELRNLLKESQNQRHCSGYANFQNSNFSYTEDNYQLQTSNEGKKLTVQTIDDNDHEITIVAEQDLEILGPINDDVITKKLIIGKVKLTIPVKVTNDENKKIIIDSNKIILEYDINQPDELDKIPKFEKFINFCQENEANLNKSIEDLNIQFEKESLRKSKFILESRISYLQKDLIILESDTRNLNLYLEADNLIKINKKNLSIINRLLNAKKIRPSLEEKILIKDIIKLDFNKRIIQLQETTFKTNTNLEIMCDRYVCLEYYLTELKKSYENLNKSFEALTDKPTSASEYLKQNMLMITRVIECIKKHQTKQMLSTEDLQKIELDFKKCQTFDCPYAKNHLNLFMLGDKIEKELTKTNQLILSTSKSKAKTLSSSFELEYFREWKNKLEQYRKNCFEIYKVNYLMNPDRNLAYKEFNNSISTLSKKIDDDIKLYDTKNIKILAKYCVEVKELNAEIKQFTDKTSKSVNQLSKYEVENKLKTLCTELQTEQNKPYDQITIKTATQIDSHRNSIKNKYYDIWYKMISEQNNYEKTFYFYSPLVKTSLGRLINKIYSFFYPNKSLYIDVHDFNKNVITKHHFFHHEAKNMSEKKNEEEIKFDNDNIVKIEKTN